MDLEMPEVDLAEEQLEVVPWNRTCLDLARAAFHRRHHRKDLRAPVAEQREVVRTCLH